jgi:hypothetical protein
MTKKKRERPLRLTALRSFAISPASRGGKRGRELLIVVMPAGGEDERHRSGAEAKFANPHFMARK